MQVVCLAVNNLADVKKQEIKHATKTMRAPVCTVSAGVAPWSDSSMVAAMHHQFVMDEKDEDLIDITQRISLTKAHTITDVTSLTSAQQYWLSQLPNLNTAIPSEAHHDLPKFNPPFNEQQMQQ